MTKEIVPGTEPLAQDEKTTLVERAKDLNIKNAHTMSVDTLKEKISEKLAGGTLKEAADTKRSEAMQRMDAQREARKLVRVITRNLNPSKQHLNHVLIKTGNKVVGTIHRAIPTQSSDQGTHIEQMLLDTMREQQYVAKVKVKHPVTKDTVTRTELRKEWQIVELEPLTQAELNELAREQALRDAATKGE